jgi:hypothetical protein
MTTDNLRLLAFHEAGHAVATWALTRQAPLVALVAYDPGMTAGRLQVVYGASGAATHQLAPHLTMPDCAYEGAPVGGDDALSGHDFEADERRVIILMAGVEAETQLTHDEDWWESEEDRKRAEDIIVAMLARGWRLEPRDEHERDLLRAHQEAARRCWAALQYRTRQLMSQPPLQAAVIALANVLLAEERIDAARVARIIRSGVAQADPDLTT